MELNMLALYPIFFCSHLSPYSVSYFLHYKSLWRKFLVLLFVKTSPVQNRGEKQFSEFVNLYVIVNGIKSKKQLQIPICLRACGKYFYLEKHIIIHKIILDICILCRLHKIYLYNITDLKLAILLK